MNMDPLIDFLEAIRIQYAVYAAIGVSVLTLLVCWTGPKGRRFIPRVLFGAFLSFSTSVFLLAFASYIFRKQIYNQHYRYLEILTSISLVFLFWFFVTLISKSVLEQKRVDRTFLIISIPLSIAMGGMVAFGFVILGKVYPLLS